MLDVPPNSFDADFAQVLPSIGGLDVHVGGASRPHASFHRTESIDDGIVLFGEITLLVDDGETVARAGDIVMQRGTNHLWVNRGNVPCRLAYSLVDGIFANDLR